MGFARVVTWAVCALLVLASLPSVTAQDAGTASVEDVLERALAARERGEYPAFLDDMKAALALAPQDTRVLYNLACAESLNGHGADALKWLEQVVASGADVDPEHDSDFDPIRSTAGFRNVLRELAARNGQAAPDAKAPKAKTADAKPKKKTAAKAAPDADAKSTPTSDAKSTVEAPDAASTVDAKPVPTPDAKPVDRPASKPPKRARASKAAAAPAPSVIAETTGAARDGVTERRVETPPAVPAPDPVIHNSVTAFALPDADLVPDALAYDLVDRRFYASSGRSGRVVVADPQGRTTEFAPTRERGQAAGSGLRIDARRRVLWASSAKPAGVMDQNASLLAYDIDGRRFLSTVEIDTSRPHRVGEIVVAKAGDVFVSDGAAGTIYRLKPGSRTPEPLLAPGALPDASGLTMTLDESRLYVAYEGGIDLFEPATGVRRPVTGAPADVVGVEGLYWYQGSLVAIQPYRHRIVWLELDRRGEKVVHTVVLESGNPLFARGAGPGVIVGSELYYLANTGRLIAPPPGTDRESALPVVLRLKLPD